MEKEEFFDLAERYSAGACSDREKQIFDDYCEKLHNAKTLDAWDLDKWEEARARLLLKINKQIDTRESHEPKTWAWVKIAASIALIVTVGWSVYTTFGIGSQTKKLSVIEKYTTKGQKLQLVLPDGSTVKINANSKLRYDENFGETERKVHLEGEGFFEVKKDIGKPFKVVTSSISTTVLGTSFNVSASRNQQLAAVTVATGKVEVALKNDKGEETNKVQVLPYQQAVFDIQKRRFHVDSVNLYTALAWKDNRLIFQDESLGKAAQVLEEWYGVTILFSNQKLKNCKFSTVFQDESLERVLEELHYILDLNYEKSKDQIVLSGNGCLN